MVLSALPSLFASSRIDNDPEEMVYLILFICSYALLIFSQYYISFVNYEIISLLLEIHIEAVANTLKRKEMVV